MELPIRSIFTPTPRVKSPDTPGSGGGSTEEFWKSVLKLRTRLRGPLLEPGQAGYEDSRTVWTR